MIYSSVQSVIQGVQETSDITLILCGLKPYISSNEMAAAELHLDVFPPLASLDTNPISRRPYLKKEYVKAIF